MLLWDKSANIPASTTCVLSSSTSAIVILSVGPEKRLFAAREDVLCVSPFFAACCHDQILEPQGKRIDLPEEQPEILSSVLEYLYKGDYYPRLLYDQRLDIWELEDSGVVDGDGQSREATIFHHAAGAEILKDTAI